MSKMWLSADEWDQKTGTEKVEQGHTQHNKTRIYSYTLPLVKGSQAHLAQISPSQSAERLLGVLPQLERLLRVLPLPERLLRVLPLRSGQVNWVGVRK